MSAEGEHVLEEAELSLVMQLKELKNRYRKTYEEYNSTKAEVSYCQHLVNQCRIRLLTGEHLKVQNVLMYCTYSSSKCIYIDCLTIINITYFAEGINRILGVLPEFEIWYNQSFLLPDQVLSVLEGGPVRPGQVPVDKALTLVCIRTTHTHLNVKVSIECDCKMLFVDGQEDEQKPFKHPSDNPQESSSAVSFYNAYNRSLLRVRHIAHT